MSKTRLKIADIVFNISEEGNRDPISPENNFTLFYSSDLPNVSVHAHYSLIPELIFTDEDEIFNSGTFWKVYKKDGLYIFKMSIKKPEEHNYGIVTCTSDFTCCNVYYRYSTNNDSPSGSLPHPLSFPIFHLLIISLLSKGTGVLVHACGIDDGGKGYLFPASSNHGKTTIARLWGNEAMVLNDERIILRQHEGHFWIYGTPWHGEYEKVSPHGIQLEKIFFLQHSNTNQIQKNFGLIATSKLLTHCFLPYWEFEGMQFTLDFCAKVVETIPCYDLGFVPDKNIIDFIRCVK